MGWKVGEKPRSSFAFFSPWFGMDPEDNLNLIQPVNPWSGSSWSMYTEYFQWSPVHNSNSAQKAVEAGQTLHGSLTYDSDTDSYLLSQKVIETSSTSTQTVKCQSGKKYTVPYIVYEKVFPCKNYPPDEEVRFYNISAECDGEDCTKDIKWSPKIKDDNCNMKANINDDGTISITWDTSLTSKYDAIEVSELVRMNSRSGWAAKMVSAKHNIGGFYHDPNHYKSGTLAGTRMISDEVGSSPSGKLTLVGSDDGIDFWSLSGAWVEKNGGKLTVDFSPKGG